MATWLRLIALYAFVKTGFTVLILLKDMRIVPDAWLISRRDALVFLKEVE